MKIGIFTDSYYPLINGVTISLENLITELRHRGHTVYIFAPRMRGYKDTDKFVVRIPALTILSSEAETRMPVFLPHKSLIKFFSLDFEIVHAHGNGPFSVLGLQVSRLKRIPFVMTFHTLYTEYTHYIFKGKIVKPRMVVKYIKVFANLCDGLIAPSGKMRELLMQYGVKKEITVIPNFIDLSLFQIKKNIFLRKKMHIPLENKILLAVGRLGVEKNIDFLIKSFALVHKAKPKTNLVIVGTGTEEQSLRELVSQLHLEGKVLFAGKVKPSTMPKVYSSADIFVFPSITEVHPMVVLEAGSSGLPMIVAKDKAFENMVIDGKNGYVVPLDTELFSSKIITILSDDSLRKKMGESSRQIIQENFAKEKIASEMLEFYTQTITNFVPQMTKLKNLAIKFFTT